MLYWQILLEQIKSTIFFTWRTLHWRILTINQRSATTDDGLKNQTSDCNALVDVFETTAGTKTSWPGEMDRSSC